jgi:tetrahydromethanopterin S-methyltransferase subunit F
MNKNKPSLESCADANNAAIEKLVEDVKGKRERSQVKARGGGLHSK